MKYIKEYSTYNNDIESICEEYGIENYTINTDGSIDVDSRVNLNNENLKNLPLNFNRVTGYFSCSSNMLTSLKGCPKIVGDMFSCSSNQLTSLDGCPEKVGGDFICSYNQLTSLEGGPEKVGGDFICSYNQLISLEGCPKEVGGGFGCSYNQLTSLEGCPIEISGNFSFHHNKLTSLKGCPKEIANEFYYRDNQLPKMIMDNVKYIRGIIKWQDEYSIWRKDGSLDEFRFNDMMIDIKNDYDLK